MKMPGSSTNINYHPINSVPASSTFNFFRHVSVSSMSLFLGLLFPEPFRSQGLSFVSRDMADRLIAISACCEGLRFNLILNIVSNAVLQAGGENLR